MPGIDEFSRDVLVRLADGMVRAALLVLVAGMALKIGRVKLPATLHAVWTVIVACMLLSPLVRVPAPRWALSLEAPAVVLPGPETPKLESATGTLGDAVSATPISRPFGWAPWLAGLYVGGAGVMMLRLGIAYRATKRLRNDPLVIDSHLQQTWEDTCARMALGWPLPEVRESKAVRVPLVVGLRSPALLLPVNWRTWNIDKLRAVLAHEAAHIKRRDGAAAALGSLNCCVFWFHPLAWWIARRLPSLAEHAADDAALSAGLDERQYAEAVLSFARIAAGGRRLLGGSAMARSGNVSSRIDRILEGPRTLGFATRRTWLTAICLAVPLVSATAALQIAATPQHQPEAMEPGTLDLLRDGNRMTAAAVADAEARLRSNPEDLTTRGQLIAYYFLNAVRSPRLEHIFWVIENHPESWVAGSYPARISPTPGLLNSTDDFARANTIWQAQIVRHASDQRVLLNAARFLDLTDVPAALRLLKQAGQIAPADPKVAQQRISLYTRILSGEVVVATNLNGPGAPMRNPRVDPALRAQVQAELESSNDAALIGAVGEAMAATAPPASFPSSQIAASVRDLWKVRSETAQRLLERAALLDPQNPRWEQALARLRNPPAPVATQIPQRIRVGGNVQHAMLLDSQPPVYPPLAQQARIQGVVRLDVTIGKDGAVVNARVAGGHPLLVPAAMEAIKTYRYKPTLLNGQPVEVLTQVDVPFQLSPTQ